jgi:hypothetical protein
LDWPKSVLAAPVRPDPGKTGLTVGPVQAIPARHLRRPNSSLQNVKELTANPKFRCPAPSWCFPPSRRGLAKAEPSSNLDELVYFVNNKNVCVYQRNARKTLTGGSCYFSDPA